MPIYVARTVEGPDGHWQHLADRDTMSTLTGYAAFTIRIRCRPVCYDQDTGRALYDQDAIVADLKARGILPRPAIQGRSRARRAGPHFHPRNA